MTKSEEEVILMCNGYESPIELITSELTSELTSQMDENIIRAVQSVGIVVHEAELIQALKYDRDSYNKGYKQGYNDCYRKIIGQKGVKELHE